MSVTREQLAMNLFLLEELEDVRRTRGLRNDDLDALRAVADWTTTFVATPDKGLGRAGPVCPFVPQALQQDTLWFAPEQIADRGPQTLRNSSAATSSCSRTLHLVTATTRSTNRSSSSSPICRRIVQGTSLATS